MQDEVNEKAIMLSIKCTKLTARLLQKAIKLLLMQIRKQIDKPLPITHGKQKQFLRQNAGVSNIGITEGNIKALEHTAKKYGIDFALKKADDRYLVFFKGRDADALMAAFQEFSAKKLTQEKKPSLRKALSVFKEAAKQKNAERAIVEKALSTLLFSIQLRYFIADTANSRIGCFPCSTQLRIITT